MTCSRFRRGFQLQDASFSAVRYGSFDLIFFAPPAELLGAGELLFRLVSLSTATRLAVTWWTV